MRTARESLGGSFERGRCHQRPPPSQLNTLATVRLMIALFDEVNSGDCGHASRALAREKIFEQMLAKKEASGYGRLGNDLFV
jgi:hypothetical protein